MQVWVVIAVGLIGLLIGSFLNVVIYRVPRGESLVSPGSRCTNCGHELTWFENVPVFAWIALRARCRACKSAISVRYPLVEVATAVLFALAAARIDRWVELTAYLFAFAGLLALSAIDFDVQRVPVAVLYPTLGATGLLLAVAAGVDDRWDDLARALAGAVIGFAVLRLIHLASPRGMGYGDVRLGFLCGLVLGWYGLTYVVVGLYGAFVLGAIVGVALIALRKGKFGKAIPFAPYLAAAAIYVSLYGEPLANGTKKIWGG
jgi:leader peptidase (prepilin peptidase) / N-methyltransferase